MHVAEVERGGGKTPPGGGGRGKEGLRVASFVIYRSLTSPLPTLKGPHSQIPDRLPIGSQGNPPPLPDGLLPPLVHGRKKARRFRCSNLSCRLRGAAFASRSHHTCLASVGALGASSTLPNVEAGVSRSAPPWHRLDLPYMYATSKRKTLTPVPPPPSLFDAESSLRSSEECKWLRLRVLAYFVANL